MRTLATLADADQAHLLRSRLEGSGIPAFVVGDNIISLDLLASFARGGGVRVEVADEDFEAALELLEDNGPTA